MGTPTRESLPQTETSPHDPLVLDYPDFSETSGQFILDTDASSGHGIGAVLSQRQSDVTEGALPYGSCALYCHERNYCATCLEMLALVDFIDHFCYYLLGLNFLCGQTIRP